MNVILCVDGGGGGGEWRLRGGSDHFGGRSASCPGPVSVGPDSISTLLPAPALSFFTGKRGDSARTPKMANQRWYVSRDLS